MGRLIILIGAPGSGKSYWARLFDMSQHIMDSRCAVVSRDEIRFSKLQDGDDYFKYEDEVKKEYLNKIREELAKDKIVVADATHLTKKSRKPLIKIGKEFNVDVDGIYFATGLKECIRRNNEREGRRKVPLSAVKRMYFSAQEPQYSEGFAFISRKE